MTRLIPAFIALLAAMLILTPALAGLPGSHPHHGGKHHGADAAAVSATTPDLKGTSREEADKLYRKKYGF